MLSFYVRSNQTTWDRYHDLVTFAYNTARQETTRTSPFQLVYGRVPVFPLDVAIRPEWMRSDDAALTLGDIAGARALARDRIAAEQARQKARYDKGRRHAEYVVGQKVMVYCPARKVGRCEKLAHKFMGPYEVIRKVSDLVYEVAILKNRKVVRDRVSIARMKPYYDPDNWMVARASGGGQEVSDPAD
jgi:hypothetical protein